MPTSAPISNAPVCPGCNGSKSVRYGELPGSNLFAGRVLREILPGGSLYRCKACGLGFRHPRPTKQQLDDLYRTGLPSAWETTAGSRPDWAFATAFIQNRFGDRFSIVDVGCFDGLFLRSLNSRSSKCGIEILPQAAERAQAAGIRILSGDFEHLRDQAEEFDAVTAFDVIEHVADPRHFMTLMAGALKPGGVLILSTGDMDCRTWRLMKHRYWYCAIPEHVSYLSLRWFLHTALSIPLRLVAARRFAHATLPVWRRSLETAANLAFLAAPKAVGLLRRCGLGNVSALLHPDAKSDYPPGWLSARDHVVVVLEKPGAAG
jgi:SAM-dependent methyltransferase